MNVAVQREDESSLLNFIRQLVQLRKENPEIGYAHWEILDTGNDAILAIHYHHHGKHLIAVHNFSEEPQQFQLKSPPASSFENVFTKERATTGQDALSLQLRGYGFGWYAASD